MALALKRKKERFGDIDIGAAGKFKLKDIRILKEILEESAFPYFVDVINFNKVSGSFKDNVFNNKILWRKH